MTKKQKLSLLRIILAALLLGTAIVLEHLGNLDSLLWWQKLGLYLLPYLLVGFSVLRRNVHQGGNGTAAPAHGAALKELAHLIEQHDGCRLRILSHAEGGDGGGGH